MGREAVGGFTLIELLVVIAIISLLVSILLPSLNRAKAMARNVVCLSDVKSIGLANMMYANANNDCMTVSRGDYLILPDETYSDGAKPDEAYYHWFNLLSEFAGQKTEMVNAPRPGSGVARCYEYPAVFRGCPEWGFKIGTTPGWTPGYGAVFPLFDYSKTPLPAVLMGHNYFSEHKPLTDGLPQRFWRRVEIANASRQGWMGDSTGYDLTGDPLQNVTDPMQGLYKNWASTNSYGNDPARHGDAANYLFVDGHAQSYGSKISGWAFTDVTQLP